MFKHSKPCPFCASENLSVELLQVMGHNEYAVMCKNCGSFGPNDLGKSGAVEMWDLRRVPATQHHAHLTPESLASSQAVVNASALSQSDSDNPPAQAQVA